MNNDYIFHVNWEDRYKQKYNVGILAQVEDEFYLAVKNKKNAPKAYENGFIGIPGFKTDVIYKSKELFDFFQNRVLKNANVNVCEELKITGGKSMIDSFSVCEMPEEEAENCKKRIVEAYKIQETLKNMIDENEMEEKLIANS